MTFGPDHYVPVLKMKRGEKKALQQVSAQVRARMTPLLEVVERNAANVQTVAEHLDTAFKDLDNAVAGFARCLLDCRELAPDGLGAATDVFSRAAKLGVVFTPVTGFSRGFDEKAALAHRANGIAIRLTRDEFESGLIPGDLPAFMKTHSLTPEEVDLIVDLGAVEDMVTPGIEALASAFLADVPDQRRWRTLTVSGCAFPLGMGGIDRNSFDLVERSEWQAWRDGLYTNRTHLDRLPTFSDCVIQHPKGVEGFDPRIMPVSASVRYALPDQWLLIKGVSTRNVPPGEQFPDLATQLVYGHLSGHFAGSTHCTGCARMFDAANGQPKLGSAEVWRRLGTIHHITRSVEGVAALTWP
ncbi:MAG: beta family protein [Kofleriaceae bacterium]|jgi:hypothetical protein|nr:beta family protein [Kofleriaceae bacterium]